MTDLSRYDGALILLWMIVGVNVAALILWR